MAPKPKAKPGAAPPDVPPPAARFTPVPFAPPKQSGQFRGATHSRTTGAVDQEHTEGVFSDPARQLLHEAVQAERPADVAAETFAHKQVFKKVKEQQDPRLGPLRLPWENEKYYSKADLDGKFPKTLRDRGFENAKTDVPAVLRETGAAHNDPKVGRLLEKQFYDKIAKQKKLLESGAPEFGKFVAPSPVDLKVRFPFSSSGEC